MHNAYNVYSGATSVQKYTVSLLMVLKIIFFRLYHYKSKFTCIRSLNLLCELVQKYKRCMTLGHFIKKNSPKKCKRCRKCRWYMFNVMCIREDTTSRIIDEMCFSLKMWFTRNVLKISFFQKCHDIIICKIIVWSSLWVVVVSSMLWVLI